MKKVILTYGTFDLFHIGHLNLLRRLKELGTNLIVGVSTDEFNSSKGKKTIIPFEDRIQIVQSMEFVDLAIAEDNWDQKKKDIEKYKVDTFGIGDDWKGKFDELKQYCEVVYLPRTNGISSTALKKNLQALDRSHIEDLKKGLDLISSIVERFD